MSLLTVSELQSQVETDYDNTTLQLIIDSAEMAIDEYIGPITGYVLEYDNIDLLTIIFLPRRATSITSVIEYMGSESEPEKITLQDDDYELSVDGTEIRRRADGTNPGTTWGWHVEVIFEPVDNTTQRKQATIKLCRLEIEHSAHDSERIGDWSSKSKDIKKEKAKILQELDNSII